MSARLACYDFDARKLRDLSMPLDARVADRDLGRARLPPLSRRAAERTRS
jgi:hypothetical protein